VQPQSKCGVHVQTRREHIDCLRRTRSTQITGITTKTSHQSARRAATYRNACGNVGGHTDEQKFVREKPKTGFSAISNWVSVQTAGITLHISVPSILTGSNRTLLNGCHIRSVDNLYYVKFWLQNQMPGPRWSANYFSRLLGKFVTGSSSWIKRRLSPRAQRPFIPRATPSGMLPSVLPGRRFTMQSGDTPEHYASVSPDVYIEGQHEKNWPGVERVVDAALTALQTQRTCVTTVHVERPLSAKSANNLRQFTPAISETAVPDPSARPIAP